MILHSSTYCIVHLLTVFHPIFLPSTPMEPMPHSGSVSGHLSYTASFIDFEGFFHPLLDSLSIMFGFQALFPLSCSSYV
jgi:hypothetical protein